MRAFAVDASGRPVASSYREFTQHFPRPGWVEHDPLEILDATLEVLASTIAQLDEPVAAIGITDQRETVVAWDRRTGRPRHRALVWQDRRTTERCDELERAGALPRIRELTGLVLDPYFSASKMEWLLRHRDVAVEGVQFHPESVLTEGGHQLLANWLVVCGDADAPRRAAGLAPVVG